MIGPRVGPKVGMKSGISEGIGEDQIAASGPLLSVAINDSADPVVGTSNFDYTVVVMNNGAVDATTVSQVTTLDASLTFVSGSGTGWVVGAVGQVVTATRASLAANTTAGTVTITVTPTNANSTVSTSANCTAANAPPANTDIETTVIVGQTTITVAIADGVDPAPGNANFNYTIVVTNTGANAATTVSQVTVLDSSLTFVSGSGTGWTVNRTGQTVTSTRSSAAVGAAPTITITVTPTNSSSTASTTADCTASNAPAATQDIETTAIVAQGTLSVAINDSADPVAGTSNYNYTVVVTVGTNTATTVSQVTVIPASCTFVSGSGTGWTVNNVSGTVTSTRASAAVGAAPTITITVTPTNADASVTATADCTAANCPAAAQATQGTTIVGQGTLVVAINDSKDPVITTASYAYTIVVTVGTNTATTVSQVTVLDPQVTFVSGSGTGWTVNNSSGTVTSTRASGAVGALPTITINVTSPSAAETSSTTADCTAANCPAATQDVETTVCNLVDKDATSLKYCPSSATQWGNFVTFFGLTAVTPDSVWLCQEASGNLADSMAAALTMIAIGTPLYSQTASGWTRIGVGADDNTSDSFGSILGPNITTTSMTWMWYWAIGTEPTASRAIGGATQNGAGTGDRAIFSPSAGNNRGGKQCVATTTNGTGDHSAGSHVLVSQYDRTNTVTRFASDVETFTGTYSGSVTNASHGLWAATSTPGNCQNVYMCMWSGAGAELSSANIKALLQALGWTIPW